MGEVKKSLFPLREEQKECSWNPFEEENSNIKHIRALLLVQNILLRDVLSDKEKGAVEYVIIQQFSQVQAAMLLGVRPSTVSRNLKRAITKLRKYLKYCNLALQYFETSP